MAYYLSGTDAQYGLVAPTGLEPPATSANGRMVIPPDDADLVAGYPRGQAVAYQRDLVGGYLLDLVAVFPQGLVAVFLQGPVVVFPLGLVVECRLVQTRI